MSVIIISPQMMADANEKASWFWRDYHNPLSENSMCPTLGKLSDLERTEFFLRLYFYNSLSYDVLYNENTTDVKQIEESWPAIQRLGRMRKKLNKGIDIYQFVNTLKFLQYNIEFHNIRDAGKSLPNMDADEKLLEDVINDLCYNIVNADIEKRHLKWFY
jgi:hypothetical protein